MTWCESGRGDLPEKIVVKIFYYDFFRQTIFVFGKRCRCKMNTIPGKRPDERNRTASEQGGAIFPRRNQSVGSSKPNSQVAANPAA